MKDMIERQAAIDALDQIFDRCEEIEAHLPEGDPDRTGYKMYPDYMTVWKYLHQLPSAQPERKRGAWVGVGFYDEDCGHHLWYACDKCSYQTTWHMKPIFNFCPSCGADMRGEQDDR